MQLDCTASRRVRQLAVRQKPSVFALPFNCERSEIQPQAERPLLYGVYPVMSIIYRDDICHYGSSS